MTRAEVLRYEQRLNAIGLSNENNRLTASQGNFESVNYVIGELRKMGYNPTLRALREHVSRRTRGRSDPARRSRSSRRSSRSTPTHGKTFVNGT